MSLLDRFRPPRRTPEPPRPAAGAPLASLKDVEARLGGRRVLHGVSVSIAAGEIVTVVGPNGAGKTTLLRVLLGAAPAASGRVWRAPGLRIGYVPQKLEVGRSLPLSVRGFLDLPRRASRQAARDALALTGVAALERRPLAQLSGGQFQRVLLARALLAGPHLLALDEPAQGLDQPGAADFYKLVDQVRREVGCAVLMISHDLHVVMSASDRVICVNGHICCEGAPEHVAAAQEYRALFGFGTGGAFALYRHEHDHDHGAADGGAAT